MCCGVLSAHVGICDECSYEVYLNYIYIHEVFGILGTQNINKEGKTNIFLGESPGPIVILAIIE